MSKQLKHDWNYRRILTDWQMPEFLERLEFDVDYFANRLAGVGAQVVQFTTKSAFGNALYPTGIGRTNPGIGDRDLFGSICEALHERDIDVIAYFNVLLDYDVSGKREEWLQRDVNGTALSFENYPMFCMSSPYTDWLIPYVEEMVAKYEIEGVMLDIQYWHGRGCFCRYCREGFESRFGHPLDHRSLDGDGLVDLAEYQRDTRGAFLSRLKSRVDETRDGLVWTWNGSGDFSLDSELDSQIDSYGTEAHPPAYDLCSAKAKWMRSSGKPYELWMPESIGSWGHHTVTTKATLKGMSALALSNGGGVTVNHSPPPGGSHGGRIFEAIYDLIDDLFDWMKARERFSGAGTSVAEVAALHSIANTNYERIQRKAAGTGSESVPDRFVGQQATVSMAALLDAIQIPFDVIHGEHALTGNAVEGFSFPRSLDEYACLILPNVGYLDQESEDAIRRYVSDGGNLISFYTTSLLERSGALRENFGLSDVIGVDFGAESDFSIGYLDRVQSPLDEGLPDIPLLFKDTGYQTPSKNRPLVCSVHDGAEVCGKITDPLIEADWSRQHHIFHDHSPQGFETDNPGVVVNAYGKGRSVYMPLPLLESYAFQPNPWYRTLVRNTLSHLGIPHLISVSAPSSARVVVEAIDDGWLVHLMRIQQETGTILLEPDGSIDITCVCRPGFEAAAVTNAVDGAECEWQAVDDAIRFTVRVNLYEIIRIGKRR